MRGRGVRLGNGRSPGWPRIASGHAAPRRGAHARGRAPLRHKVARQKSQPRQSCTSRRAPFSGRGRKFLPPVSLAPALKRRRSDRWRSMPRPPMRAYVASPRAPPVVRCCFADPRSLCPGHRPCLAAARGHASGRVGARRPGPCVLSPCREAFSLKTASRLRTLRSILLPDIFARRLCRNQSLL